VKRLTEASTREARSLNQNHAMLLEGERAAHASALKLRNDTIAALEVRAGRS